ncbi:MAG: N-acetylglucosamine-6-phosphate deacetylase [Pseudomonadota bacterium]
MTRIRIFTGGSVFDGAQFYPACDLRLSGSTILEIGPGLNRHDADEEIDLAGDILCPGFVDLQVNGGDGIMFNDDPSIETLERIAGAHGALGASTILPTLITDTPDKTFAACAAAIEAARVGLPGIGGLHLEGPHISVEKCGAHDPALVRPLEAADLQLLLETVSQLPVLFVTLAPEAVTPDQVATLKKAGVRISLGHTAADFDTCVAYMQMGAMCVTHLFNAMSQLSSRQPGLVGATFAQDAVFAGLIADGIHVHPQSIRTAFDASSGAERIFLVSDAMAPTGTDIGQFELNGRTVTRRDGRLTLADGTLAGADLTLTRAVRVLVEDVGIPLETALRAATSVPAAAAGLAKPAGHLAAGSSGPVLRLSHALDRVTVLNSGV